MCKLPTAHSSSAPFNKALIILHEIFGAVFFFLHLNTNSNCTTTVYLQIKEDAESFSKRLPRGP